jgi:hypothetical protein
MNNDITLKYPFFQKALDKIQSIHPEWAIRIESVYKAFNGILPPKGYFDDFVPQALIRSQNKEWRAWLVPSTVKDIDDYIPLEYQNVIHVHAPLELSKPLDELLSTDAGIKEFIRKSNRDILCKIPDSIEFENNPSKLIAILEKIPHFDALALLNERIKIIEEDLRDIQFFISNLPQTKNIRKHILQLLLITIDSIGIIVKTPLNITDIKGSQVPRNTFESGFPREIRKNKCKYSNMRNELLHESMWYDTAVISPDNPKDLLDFYNKICHYWEEIKEIHKFEKHQFNLT